MKLTDAKIRQLKPQDSKLAVGDGNGLYLIVSPSSEKYWQHRYKIADPTKASGRKNDTHSLGVYPQLSLKEARERLAEGKKLLSAGVNPKLQARHDKLRSIEQGANTFKVTAERWYAINLAKWKPKQAKTILSRLNKYVYPRIGEMPVTEIRTLQCLEVLREMEGLGLGDSTRRVRQYMNSIFNFAKSEGRLDYNPAEGLEQAMKPLPRTEHRRALSIDRVGQFVRDLDKYQGIYVKYGLKLILLTFCRTAELRFMEWKDIDLDEGVWRLPVEKQKMGRHRENAHLVPLSKQALAILQEMQGYTGSKKYVFYSHQSKSGAYSENTFLKARESLGYAKEMTVHGLRTTATSEIKEAGFRPDIVNFQLSHVKQGSEADKAYDRAQYIDYRRRMMQWWADAVDCLAAGEEVPPVSELALHLVI